MMGVFSIVCGRGIVLDKSAGFTLLVEPRIPAVTRVDQSACRCSCPLGQGLALFLREAKRVTFYSLFHPPRSEERRVGKECVP